MSLDLRPAGSFSMDELAGLFTAGFAEYFVPISADAAALERMVASWDLDLDASRVALRDGEPVGLALLGVRGRRGWIGGTGVVPAARRQGVGDAVMRAVLDEARRLGLEHVTLEVLVQNAPAIALYRRLGFEPVRELEIWQLEASDNLLLASEAAGEVGEVTEVELAEAQEAIAALRRGPEPWQRADETVARVPDARAVALDGAAAVFRVADGRASVLQLAAAEAGAARALLRAILAEARSLAWVNAPAGDTASEAFAALGGRVAERQHELRLSL